MNTYLITFNADPSKPSLKLRHQKLLDAIGLLERHLLLSFEHGFAYLVSTQDSIETLWQKLFKNNQSDFVNDEHLYIMAVCKPFHAFGPLRLRQWFDDHIPDEMNPLEDHVN